MDAPRTEGPTMDGVWRLVPIDRHEGGPAMRLQVALESSALASAGERSALQVRAAERARGLPVGAPQRS